MRRFLVALVVALAVLAASSTTAFADDSVPVQAATQSADTSQGAIAGSSATQVNPSNQNISVRVLSPGDDGAVTQSNDASSSANASNDADTKQSADQSQGSSCSCSGSDPGVQASQQDASTDQTALAASSATQIEPSNSNISVRVLSPGDNGSVNQSNSASSEANASNDADTHQSVSQDPRGGGSADQAATQKADTEQLAVG